jgi:hypothetical protein
MEVDMKRPGLGLVLAFVVLMQIDSPLLAQPISIVAPTTTPATTSSSSSLTPSASQIDFSAMNWRFGQMSPSTQQTVTNSSTTHSTVPPPAAPTTTANNPFVSGTLSSQGSLLTTGTTSTGTSTSAVAGPSSGTHVTSSFAPRFVTFDTLVPTNGVNMTIEAPVIDTSMNLIRFTPTPLTGGLTAVPEPGTILLCGGVLAIIGYGYSRRRLKVEGKAGEKEGGTEEAVGV